MNDKNRSAASRVKPEVHAEICKVFSNSKRLDILTMLKAGELSVGEIREQLRTTKATASKHLTLMRMCGILKARRDGTNVYYRLANRKLAEACDLMQEALAQITTDAMPWL